MLKTNVEHPAKPFAIFMAYAILKGYLKRPFRFLLSTLLTLPRFKQALPPDLPKDFVRSVALQTWLYLRLQQLVGRERAYEITRAVVLPIALAVQNGNFRVVEAPRTFKNLIRFQQRTNREGPTKWNQMVIVEQSEQRYAFRVKTCRFHDFFSRMGVPELTRFMCDTDHAVFSSYLPEAVTFHRDGPGNTIADGAAECRFVLEHHRP